jgi:DNA-3-methyladenine glycosylase II
MDHLARSEHLAQIHGIGQWTCDMVSLFYCRDPDVWPEGDLAVQRVFARYIGRRKPARAAAVFAPHRSLLALYMWRLVDAIPSD